MQGCGISRTEDGVDFSLFGTILCGPGASSEERKVKQLFEAIKAVELERAMLCLTKGTAVDARDKAGYTPLQRAVLANSAPAVRFLLKNGADAHLRTPDGRSMLDLTNIQEEIHAVLSRFIDGTASSRSLGDDYSPNSASAASLTEGPTGPARMGSLPTSSSASSILQRSNSAKKVESPAEVQEAKNAKLASAAFFSDVQECIIALKEGADVNFRDTSGMTPLLWAANKGSFEVASLLLEFRADTSCRNGDGWSALHWACHSGHLAIVELLVQNGADSAALNKHGRRPIDMAKSDAIRAALVNAPTAVPPPQQPVRAPEGAHDERRQQGDSPAGQSGNPSGGISVVDPRQAHHPAAGGGQGQGQPGWAANSKEPAHGGSASVFTAALSSMSTGQGDQGSPAGLQVGAERLQSVLGALVAHDSDDGWRYALGSGGDPAHDGSSAGHLPSSGGVGYGRGEAVPPQRSDPAASPDFMTDQQRQRADALRAKLERLTIETAQANPPVVGRGLTVPAAGGSEALFSAAAPVPAPLPHGWLVADGDEEDDG